MFVDMIDLTEIKSKYFDLLEDKISVKEFEIWVYQSKHLEKELSKDEYLNLISLHFDRVSKEYEIGKILKNHIDEGKLETVRFLSLLESIIKRDGKEGEALMRMYDLYCGGYSFLKDLGLGIGLHIEVPPTEYGVDYYHELNDNQKKKLVNDAYPIAKDLAEELKNWILNEKLILTGEEDDDLGRWQFIDKRTAEEKASKIWKTIEKTDDFQVQQNLWLDENDDSESESKPKKKWWQKLFEK